MRLLCLVALLALCGSADTFTASPRTAFLLGAPMRNGASPQPRWIPPSLGRAGGGLKPSMSLSPSVLFRAPSIIVIDKPFGVRMDGDFEDTVERLIKTIVPGKARFIHQLDFATSGTLMLGLDKACTARVNAHFERGEVRKEYLALLEGILEDSTTVEAPICRYEGEATLPPRGPPGTHGKSKDFRMMIGEGSAENPGRLSTTHIEPLTQGIYQGRPVTRAVLRPISGRRHQLRLHTRHIGHEIVGDFTYSCDRERARNCDRMMLHASRIEMPWHDSYGECLRGGCEGVTWGGTGKGGDRPHIWFQAPDPFGRFCE